MYKLKKDFLYKQGIIYITLTYKYHRVGFICSSTLIRCMMSCAFYKKFPEGSWIVMKVNVSGKNFDVTRALKEYAEKKVGRLERFFETNVEAQVTLSVEKNRHITEVTMPINGMLLRGETETQDMYSSIDMVVDKLEKQIEKYKTKISRNIKKSSLRYNDKEHKATKDNEPKIVRVKRFALKPMDIEEAVMQMDLLGHDFFVFSNAESNEVNVVYKRRDGNYGLIDPELL